MPEPVRLRTEFEKALIREIEGGLPLVTRPYAELAERLGASEAQVIRTLDSLQRSGDIKRLGVIVRHRELGYRANAMVVWDVPDDDVDAVGRTFGNASFVTLCYRRPRQLPEWRYNLFTMIHGRDREHVLAMIDRLRAMISGPPFVHEVLFSGRRFKQRGARYAADGSAPGAGAAVEAARGERR